MNPDSIDDRMTSNLMSWWTTPSARATNGPWITYLFKNLPSFLEAAVADGLLEQAGLDERSQPLYRLPHVHQWVVDRVEHGSRVPSPAYPVGNDTLTITYRCTNLGCPIKTVDSETFVAPPDA